jgi:predicted glutamine amidotransferase
MCIAIVNKSSMLEESIFENSFENNPDGCGMAYVMKGKIKMIHNMTSWKSLYEHYQLIRPVTKHPILIHFRIGTSGIKDERNLHPFMVTDDMALIHNGIVPYSVIEKDKSDTWHFVQFLKSLKNPHSLLNKNSTEFNMVSAITIGSKICLLHKDGSFNIINEPAGTWNDDTWFSNRTYESCSYTRFDWDWKPSWKGNSEPIDLGYTFKDLSDWPAKIDDIDDIYDNYMDESDFKKMTYANKVMAVLTIGNALYDIDATINAHKAVLSLQVLNSVTTIDDLYSELIKDYNRTYYASYETEEELFRNRMSYESA